MCRNRSFCHELHQREKFKRIKTDSQERIESETIDFSENVNKNTIAGKETKIEKEIHKNYKNENKQEKLKIDTKDENENEIKKDKRVFNKIKQKKRHEKQEIKYFKNSNEK